MNAENGDAFVPKKDEEDKGAETEALPEQWDGEKVLSWRLVCSQLCVDKYYVSELWSFTILPRPYLYANILKHWRQVHLEFSKTILRACSSPSQDSK